MRLLLTGGSGQLGFEVQRLVAPTIECVAPSRAELDFLAMSQEDIGDVVRTIRPTHILHGAAWTAVDAAENDPASAHRVNVAGTRALAEAAAAIGARMLYVSTDFVFGAGHDKPIATDAPHAPLNVYGASKSEGEAAVREALADASVILRTAWVYSAHGQNFVKTMLRLMRERDTLNVVADQIGTPTWANTLALGALALLQQKASGDWHLTDAGTASWYDFAVAIYEEARARGILEREVVIRPIGSADYPTPARRPHYSVLDKRETWASDVVPPVHWREQLRRALDEIVSAKS